MRFYVGDRLSLYFQPLQDMSRDTSSAIIQRRMQSTGVYSHYSTWTCKDQQSTIKVCGLTNSKYSNKVKRNEILSHLAKVDLPSDPGLRALRDLNVSILGVKNRQQFAYLFYGGTTHSMTEDCDFD